MATIAAARGITGLGGGVKLRTLNSKPISSPFLGRKLRIRTTSTFESQPNTKGCLVYVAAAASGGLELMGAAHDLFVGVGVGLPCTVMECGDFIYRSTLPRSNEAGLTAPGVVLALGALSYLWATPGVAPGFFDMFFLAFVERAFRPTYKKVSKLQQLNILFFSIFVYWLGLLVVNLHVSFWFVMTG